MLSLGLASGLAIFALWTAWRSVFLVKEGHAALLSVFGAVVREGGGHSSPIKVFGPGLHRRAPWAHAHIVSMKEQGLDLSGDTGGSTAMTADGTLLRFDSSMRYQPDARSLDSFVFGLKRPKEHVAGLFSCLLRNELANFKSQDPALAKAPVDDGGSYAIIRRERSQLNTRIQSFCRDTLGDRYGVRFNAVDLTDILPPDELADALNAVMNARMEADTRYAHAQGECQQRVLASRQGVEIARQRAMAARQEVETLCGMLAGLEATGSLAMYVERRRAEVLGSSRTVFFKEVR